MTLAGNVLIGFGVAFLLLAALGTVRLPDAFARMHAGSKATTLGLASTLLGATLALGSLRYQLLLAIAFQLATAPLAAHAIGRAAHRARVASSRRTTVDELDRDERARGGDHGAGGEG